MKTKTKKEKIRVAHCSTTDYLTVKDANKMIRAQFKKKDQNRAVAKFWEWHNGQTGIVIAYNDGTTESGVYLWDVERWIELILRKKQTYFD